MYITKGRKAEEEGERKHNAELGRMSAMILAGLGARSYIEVYHVNSSYY